MQIPDSFHSQYFESIRENELISTFFPLLEGERIFFYGDLGTGKSTYIRSWLRHHFHDPNLIVRSPTYTYFQKYGTNVYHFDLYRLESLEDFYLIGGNDILEDPHSICLIEWPDILSGSILPDRIVSLTRTSDTERTIMIASQLL